MHWAIVLRSDLQDQRQETRTLVDNLRQETRSVVDTLRQEMRDQRREMMERFDRIDDRIEQQRLQLEHRMDSRFYWTIGLILTLLGMQTGMILKLFVA